MATSPPGNFTLTSLPVQEGVTVNVGSGRLELSGATSYTIAYRGASGAEVFKPFTVVP